MIYTPTAWPIKKRAQFLYAVVQSQIAVIGKHTSTIPVPSTARKTYYRCSVCQASGWVYRHTLPHGYDIDYGYRLEGDIFTLSCEQVQAQRAFSTLQGM